MSYCRWGQGDVYVYWGLLEDDSPVWVCAECRLRKADSHGWRRDTHCKDRQAMIERLESHRLVGHSVPEAAIERLRAEIQKGDFTTNQTVHRDKA